MNRIFNLDNKFFTGLNKVIDAFYITLLFLISCVPVFTAGAALSALYYTINKQLIHSRGYVWSTYWGAFKSNFKNSTIVWLIHMVLTIIMAFDLYITYHLQASGSKLGALFFVFLVFMILLYSFGAYLYGYLARFDQERKTACKTAIIIGMANIGWTMLIAVILVAAFVALYLFPGLILLITVIAAMLCYLILEHVFKKYMRPEDIAREEEEYRYDY